MSSLKLFKFLPYLVLFATLSLIAGISSAHNALKESTPADESTVETPPAEISLVFNGPVRLVKVELLVSGEQISTEFRPSAEPQDQFVIATPDLQAGNYTVNWAAIGEDGHTVSNSFGFMVGTGSVASAP
ncbi:MAG: copper resistance protein CopC [Gammaproteobacteria bacterium]|nr:copper resistance protein CopC [Gammaproteobacteria bacterium]MCY4358621.1 copper resistance protein CopC [Gammaproteobacteria bacterium]